MNVQTFFLVACVFFHLQLGSAQENLGEERRSVIVLNDRWEYLEVDAESPRDLPSIDGGWIPVTLPHTWNSRDVVDAVPGYRRSASWYRRVLNISRLRSVKRYFLSFEGVNISCDVFVNGTRAGGHVGGYVPFDVELTTYLRPGQSNTILVRVDNGVNRDIIPSQKSDFCVYGGITRDVRLTVVPSVFISRLHINTPEVGSDRAVAEFVVSLDGQTSASGNLELVYLLRDPSGIEVDRTTLKIPRTNRGDARLMADLPVNRPLLWSPSQPALYTATVALLRDGQTIDEVSERLGFRWFEFVPGGPFMLNGKRLLLRGTHRHEDWAGLGNALPDSLHRKDIRMIKEMGANFVRLAHYPQDPEVYRACDELGLLVWDELPWCRGGMGGEVWRANTKRLLKEQIDRYYNHPSIIIRSLGNEMYWLPDFAGGDQLDSLRGMVTELHDIAHRLDPGRVTATRKFTEGADLVDIVSPSIWPGWYGGYYKNYETALAETRTRLSKFFHAEYGGDSHVGRHTEFPISGDATAGSDGWEENIKPGRVRNVAQSGDWSESYIVDLFDWMLTVSEQTPWLTGNAQWAFKDFPTPLRPENPIPYMNQKGLVDRSGVPKDAYYVFKSYWTEYPKFAYIESHTWDERAGPEGTKREVNVFSNCAEVELFVNGVTVGKRRRMIGSFPASGLSWDVDFVAGSNSLLAVGYGEGKAVTRDSMSLRYTTTKHDLPDRIELLSEPRSDGSLLLTATVVDKNGRRCLDYNKRVYFAADGAGRLLVDEGIPTRSSIIELASGRARVEFQPDPYGRAIIEARNQDFKGAYLVVEKGAVVDRWK